MLPDIASQQAGRSPHDRPIGVRALQYGQLSSLTQHKPDPAVAELSSRRAGEISAELGIIAKRIPDAAGDDAGRWATAIGMDAVSVERVVPGLRGIIVNGSASPITECGFDDFDDIIEGSVFQLTKDGSAEPAGRPRFIHRVRRVSEAASQFGEPRGAAQSSAARGAVQRIPCLSERANPALAQRGIVQWPAAG